VYRSLGEEFKKLYRLNRIVPGIVEEEAEIIGEPLTQSDYDDEGQIIPGGDPTGDSESTKQMKIDAVGQMLQLGTINVQAFTQWALQAKEIPNYQQLMQQPPPPPPDPKAESEKMKQQTMQQKAALDAEAKQQEIQAKEAISQIEQGRAAAKFEHEQQMAALKMQEARMQTQMDAISKVTEQRHNQAKSQMDLMHTNAKAAQDMAIAKQKAASQNKAAKAGGSKKSK
jgi:hypothetical protein